MKKEKFYFIEVYNDYDRCLYLVNDAELNRIKSTAELCNMNYFILPLVASGKSYQEKKAAITEQALLFSIGVKDEFLLNDYCIIHDYFLKNGKRYGLISEFTENGII